jgi:hypothetical protein
MTIFFIYKIQGRRAKIYKPARNAMQSGWENVGVWKIDLDNRERWENPNIGWCSRWDDFENFSLINLLNKFLAQIHSATLACNSTSPRWTMLSISARRTDGHMKFVSHKSGR